MYIYIYTPLHVSCVSLRLSACMDKAAVFWTAAHFGVPAAALEYAWRIVRIAGGIAKAF